MAEEVTGGWVVRGLVQGVGFRHWTRREGERLGIRGFVRNLADGSVEVQAAGEAERIAQLEQRLHRGPPGAQVTLVEPHPGREALPDRFEIRR